jgi:hypothetical protein
VPLHDLVHGIDALDRLADGAAAALGLAEVDRPEEGVEAPLAQAAILLGFARHP